MSHPSRVRGLKFSNKADEFEENLNVAPFTGAWIEIPPAWSTYGCMLGSHPSRVRGLKLRYASRYDEATGVAPFTGAWIEIKNGSNFAIRLYVAPFTGAWIEIRVPYSYL